MNFKHPLKVGLAWTSIVYVVCFAGVALFPALRESFMKYGMHTDAALGHNYITIGSFIGGLIIWNIIVAIGVWLFVLLSNKIK